MNWIHLGLIRCAALALVVLGAAKVAFADTGCFLWVFKAAGQEYMENRPGYPQCHYQVCTPPTNQCQVRTINIGGQMYQYCNCKKLSAGDGCFLGYSGTEPTGGSASCINMCSGTQICPAVSWGLSTWDPTVEIAHACGSCQTPPP